MKTKNLNKNNLLYDFYKSLLTERQSELFVMYYFEDNSMEEIGNQFNISKAAVSDSLRNTLLLLNSYEEKLQLVSKHLKRIDLLDKCNCNVSKELLKIEFD